MLILDKNGLSDKGVQLILEGIRRQETIESINISKNDLGSLSVETLGQIIDMQNSSHQIQEFRLSNIKFSKNSLNKLFQYLNESSVYGFLALKLSFLNLRDIDIGNYLMKCSALIDLNLECSQLQQAQMTQVLHCLVQKNSQLKWLNIANNCISTIEPLLTLIKESKLQHLNLSSMGLT